MVFSTPKTEFSQSVNSLRNCGESSWHNWSFNGDVIAILEIVKNENLKNKTFYTNSFLFVTPISFFGYKVNLNQKAQKGYFGRPANDWDTSIIGCETMAVKICDVP